MCLWMSQPKIDLVNCWPFFIFLFFFKLAIKLSFFGRSKKAIAEGIHAFPAFCIHNWEFEVKATNIETISLTGKQRLRFGSPPALRLVVCLELWVLQVISCVFGLQQESDKNLNGHNYRNWTKHILKLGLHRTLKMQTGTHLSIYQASAPCFPDIALPETSPPLCRLILVGDKITMVVSSANLVSQYGVNCVWDGIHSGSIVMICKPQRKEYKFNYPLSSMQSLMCSSISPSQEGCDGV